MGYTTAKSISSASRSLSGFVPSHRYPFDEDWAIELWWRSLEALRTIEGIEVIA